MTTTTSNPILDRLRAMPLLTADEEKALARRRDAGDRSAVDELVYRNQRLLLRIAERRRNCKIGIDDLVSAGQAGLLMAAERFDPERGVKFGTFASYWIKQTIQRETENASSLIRVPSYLYHGRKARRANPSLIDTANAVRNATYVSIDESRGDDRADLFHPSHVDTIADAMDAAEASVSKRSIILSAVAQIKQPHARIFTQIHGLDGNAPRTAASIAAEMGVSKQRVRQIKAEATRMLRRVIERRQQVA